MNKKLAWALAALALPIATGPARPVAEVFHGTFPHFIAHLIAIAILVAFPSIILWLPSQMGR